MGEDQEEVGVVSKSSVVAISRGFQTVVVVGKIFQDSVFVGRENFHCFKISPIG